MNSPSSSQQGHTDDNRLLPLASTAFDHPEPSLVVPEHATAGRFSDASSLSSSSNNGRGARDTRSRARGGPSRDAGSDRVEVGTDPGVAWPSFASASESPLSHTARLERTYDTSSGNERSSRSESSGGNIIRPGQFSPSPGSEFPPSSPENRARSNGDGGRHDRPTSRMSWHSDLRPAVGAGAAETSAGLGLPAWSDDSPRAQGGEYLGQHGDANTSEESGGTGKLDEEYPEGVYDARTEVREDGRPRVESTASEAALYPTSGGERSSRSPTTRRPSPRNAPTDSYPLRTLNNRTEDPRPNNFPFLRSRSNEDIPFYDVPLTFRRPELNLNLLLYPGWLPKLHHLSYVWLSLWHIPATIFLDYNAIYTLVQVAQYPPSPAPNSSSLWWIAVAGYAFCTAVWLFGITIFFEYLYSYLRVWSQARPSISTVYTSSAACKYTCAFRSYAYYSFIYHAQMAAFQGTGPVPASARDGFLELFWWYSQNWSTVLTLLPRAGICLAILLAFRTPGTNPSTSRDTAYFQPDGQLSDYAYGVLISNVAWTGWRLLVVFLSWMGLLILGGPGTLRRLTGYPKKGLRLPSEGYDFQDPVVDMDWFERTDARLRELAQFCTSRTRSDGSTSEGLRGATSDPAPSNGMTERKLSSSLGVASVGAATAKPASTSTQVQRSASTSDKYTPYVPLSNLRGREPSSSRRSSIARAPNGRPPFRDNHPTAGDSPSPPNEGGSTTIHSFTNSRTHSQLSSTMSGEWGSAFPAPPTRTGAEIAARPARHSNPIVAPAAAAVQLPGGGISDGSSFVTNPSDEEDEEATSEFQEWMRYPDPTGERYNQFALARLESAHQQFAGDELQVDPSMAGGEYDDAEEENLDLFGYTPNGPLMAIREESNEDDASVSLRRRASIRTISTSGAASRASSYRQSSIRVPITPIVAGGSIFGTAEDDDDRPPSSKRTRSVASPADDDLEHVGAEFDSCTADTTPNLSQPGGAYHSPRSSSATATTSNTFGVFSEGDGMDGQQSRGSTPLSFRAI